MKYEKIIENSSEIVEKDYSVVYYNETTNDCCLKSNTPSITITVEDTTDTAVINLTAEKNQAVRGTIEWSCDIDSSYYKIEGTNFVFLKHFDSSMTLTAKAKNCRTSKLINVICDEVITATTYASGSVETISDVDASATTAVLNYTVIPCYHYKLKPTESGSPISCSNTISFEANTKLTEVYRASSFTDTTYEAEIPWEFYHKSAANFNGYEYVSLRLPSGKLWATMNVGASTVEGYGNYFQWGGTKGYTSSSRPNNWYDCPFNNGSSTYNSTYWNSVRDSVTTSQGNYRNLNPEYDAATQKMSGDWTMPTYDDFLELSANTNAIDWTINGVKGKRFSSKKDVTRFIFFPYAGFSIYDGCWPENDCYIWSKTHDSSGKGQYAKFLVSTSSSVSPGKNEIGDTLRYDGFSIRGIVG